jgi:hypothetical protein
VDAAMADAAAMAAQDLGALPEMIPVAVAHTTMVRPVMPAEALTMLQMIAVAAITGKIKAVAAASRAFSRTTIGFRENPVTFEKKVAGFFSRTCLIHVVRDKIL